MRTEKPGTRTGYPKKKKKQTGTGFFWFVFFATVILCVILSVTPKEKKTKQEWMIGSLYPYSGSKTSIGLANFAWNALDCRSGYVFGAVGQRITPEFLRQQAVRFSGNSRANLSESEVAKIDERYRNHPAFDCVGLLKAYSWFDEETGGLSYGKKNAMPDCTANGLLAQASVYGPIAVMPDTPGLAVQMDGHIGIYVGGGVVIEAQGNRSGVTKTTLNARGWKWYFRVPGIDYPQSGVYIIHGHTILLKHGQIARESFLSDRY